MPIRSLGAARARATSSCGRGAVHDGRRSRRSGRATATRRIGADAKPSTYSTRSRKVGSAQSKSSSTTINGRSRASASSSLRTAQNVSSGDVARFALPDCCSDALRHQGAVLRNERRNRACIAAGDLFDDLDQRPVCDAIAVRKAMADHITGIPSAFDELPDETRLTDAGSAQHRHEAARTLGHAVSELVPKDHQLRRASDERRVTAARDRCRVRQHLEQPEGLHLRAFPFQIKGFECLDEHAIANQPVCRRADHDLSWSRGLFQARRKVHRITRDQPLSGRRITRDHLTGVDAGARFNPDTVIARELHVERDQPLAHRGRCLHRSQCVVFVQLWNTEDRHDRVPDELLDDTTVALDDILHRIEVPREDAAQRLRIQALAERS